MAREARRSRHVQAAQPPPPSPNALHNKHRLWAWWVQGGGGRGSPTQAAAAAAGARRPQHRAASDASGRHPAVRAGHSSHRRRHRWRSCTGPRPTQQEGLLESVCGAGWAPRGRRWRVASSGGRRSWLPRCRASVRLLRLFAAARQAPLGCPRQANWEVAAQRCALLVGGLGAATVARRPSLLGPVAPRTPWSAPSTTPRRPRAPRPPPDPNILESADCVCAKRDAAMQRWAMLASDELGAAARLLTSYHHQHGG